MHIDFPRPRSLKNFLTGPVSGVSVCVAVCALCLCVSVRFVRVCVCVCVFAHAARVWGSSECACHVVHRAPAALAERGRPRLEEWEADKIGDYIGGHLKVRCARATEIQWECGPPLTGECNNAAARAHETGRGRACVSGPGGPRLDVRARPPDRGRSVASEVVVVGFVVPHAEV